MSTIAEAEAREAMALENRAHGLSPKGTKRIDALKKRGVDILEDEKVNLSDKLDSISNLILKNKEEIMIRIEKFLLNTIQEDTLDSQEKFRVIDRFNRINGSMLMKTVTWIHYSTIELYWFLFKSNIPITYKLQAMNAVLRSDAQVYRKNEAINNMMTVLRENHATLTLHELSNVIDTLLTSGNASAVVLAEEYLTHLRTREQAENALNRELGGNHDIYRPGHVPRKPITVYSDSQNVHDSTINNSVKVFIDELSQDVHKEEMKHKILDKTPGEILDQIRLELGEVTPLVAKSLSRIEIDFAQFSLKSRLRLRDILQRVWHRIKNTMTEEVQKEAVIRMRQELTEMAGLCSTGHMTRIINIISGLECGGTVVQAVKISFEEQLNANIQARINSRLQKHEKVDDLLEAIIEFGEQRQPYRDFLEEIKESLKEELEKEFTGLITPKEFESIFSNYYPLE